MTTTAPPKVSVLISTYNRPDYLQEAVNSVINQSMSDWELLIMNDGGLDVGPILDGYHEPRIRYFNDTQNKGAAHRFNFGLTKARGAYVTYLGDDDLYYPNHLEVLSQALDDHPEVALAYSDLYAVSCVKDEATGRRYVLDKRIQVSRDFNRDFMMHYNHVLHVSLMHRIEAAFRVGCFDENVKVLIEWSLNRRLCFIYDFIYVPIPTGEYYMPVFKSDRISVLQRKDKDSYRHNLRIIRSNLPDEPWDKMDKVDFIYPVAVWDESVKTNVGDIIDNIDHPIHIILVNNEPRRKRKDCWKKLGQLAELNNIVIVTPPHPLTELDAYRFGAMSSKAEYIYLFSKHTQLKAVNKRIIAGLEIMKKHILQALRWDVNEEKKSEFDIFLKRDLFLQKSDLRSKPEPLSVRTVPPIPPSSFTFDLLFAEARRSFSKGDYAKAYEFMKRTITLEKGAPGIQFCVDLLVKICLANKDYQAAEKQVRQLLKRGYTPDNWVRLGQILQETNKYKEALEAYHNGLKGIGLTEGDLESPVFPFNFPKELSAFTALMGLGDCCFNLGEYAECAKHYRRAAKLRANSHRPFLGFTKLFLATNQLEQAEATMSKIGQRGGKMDPETHRILAKICEKRRNYELAFSCCLNAFAANKRDEKNLDPLFYAGARLDKWVELNGALEEFLKLTPNHLSAIAKLSETCYRLGDLSRARDLTAQGLGMEPENLALANLSARLNQTSAAQPENSVMTAGEDEKYSTSVWPGIECEAHSRP
jgi:glycosyltransferase involved in cell wall biosynthesis/tetratricopeptide (TPR) repeat protein